MRHFLLGFFFFIALFSVRADAESDVQLNGMYVRDLPQDKSQVAPSIKFFVFSQDGTYLTGDHPRELKKRGSYTVKDSKLIMEIPDDADIGPEIAVEIEETGDGFVGKQTLGGREAYLRFLKVHPVREEDWLKGEWLQFQRVMPNGDTVVYEPVKLSIGQNHFKNPQQGKPLLSYRTECKDQRVLFWFVNTDKPDAGPLSIYRAGPYLMISYLPFSEARSSGRKNLLYMYKKQSGRTSSNDNVPKEDGK